jgi:hypothetical protein
MSSSYKMYQKPVSNWVLLEQEMILNVMTDFGDSSQG